MPYGTILVMSVRGIGVDMVAIKRFSDAALGASRKAFLAKTFTAAEVAYCSAFADRERRLAGTFAAKEAAAKAYDGKYHLTSFEVRRARSGKPEIWKGARKLASLKVSITHDGDYALAMCVRI